MVLFYAKFAPFGDKFELGLDVAGKIRLTVTNGDISNSATIM